jgi:cobalt-zinc-cadmium efflux system membrane fusion protein
MITDSTDQLATIHLSMKEIEQAGIKFGSFSEQTIDRWVPCSGYVVVSQDDMIRVSPPAPGIIRSVNCTWGGYAEAGTVLATLENIEFLKLQQEYLEAENQLDYMREEYKRQGELTVENATSVKKMQVARRDYQSAELKLHALRSQLETYGIFADSLKYNNLTTLIFIKAPRSGYVSKINARVGSYVKLGEELLDMCNNSRKLLKLSVPEQFISDLKIGQSVDFFLSHDSLSVHKAILQSLASSIDRKNHTAEMYARISKVEDFFLPGMSVSARIKTNTVITKAILAELILHEPNGNYLFVMNQGVFTRIPIRTGDSFGDLTEIIDFPLSDKQDSIVVQGGSYLNALLEQP